MLVELQATSRGKASEMKQAVQLTLLNGKNKRSRSTTQLGEPAVTKAPHPSEYLGKLLWLRAPSFVATYAIQRARPSLNLGHRLNTGPQESTWKRSRFPNSKQFWGELVLRYRSVCYWKLPALASKTQWTSFDVQKQLERCTKFGCSIFRWKLLSHFIFGYFNFLTQLVKGIHSIFDQFETDTLHALSMIRFCKDLKRLRNVYS